MPRPKVVLHVLRPSSGALAVHYRRITPWHAWLGPQDHAAGWPTLHTAETAALTTHVGSFRPLILQCTPLPPASVHYSCQAAPKRLAARQASSGDGVPEALLQEICGGAGGMVKRLSLIHI